MSTFNLVGLPQTTDRVNMLVSDFSGLVNLDSIVERALKQISLSDNVQRNVALKKSGAISASDFDASFAEVVRVELGKTLGIIRAKAVSKAAAAGAGSASGAVMRRSYKNEYGGNINIGGHRGRMSSRSRVVPPPDGGKSGIRRVRTVKERTKRINEYYGPDRDFILRIFSEGRDVFRATPEGAVGRRSMATYGVRGAMSPRWNFVNSMQSDMMEAAEQLGFDLTKWVENFIETKFTENQ